MRFGNVLGGGEFTRRYGTRQAIPDDIEVLIVHTQYVLNPKSFKATVCVKSLEL